MKDGLSVCYLYDDAERAWRNAEGCNYWYRYIEEILDELGLAAAGISIKEIREEGLKSLNYLISGDIELPDDVAEKIQNWIQKGGIFIGFGTRNAGDIFGIKVIGYELQPDDEYTTSAYCKFREPALKDYINVMDEKTVLPVISPLSKVEAAESDILAMFTEGSWTGILNRSETGWPCIMKKGIGKGSAFYFAFNLPQTIWALHQGRPVTRDYDGDGYYRAADGIVLSPKADFKIPYADYWLIFLQAILSSIPQPFIHQLPPGKGGEVPDFLLYYAGDDEGTPGVAVKSSDLMKERGLPYHINCMMNVDGFALTQAEYKRIKENGHEVSLHPDFVKPYFHFTESDFLRQLDGFINTFHEIPVVNTNHWGTFTGWTEQARWASKKGCKGDNSRLHSFVANMTNPINNPGFGFGTTYPHFVYDDFTAGNERLDFVYIPIAFHEPRVYDESAEKDIGQIREMLEQAARFGRTFNIFVHPCYVIENKECNRALDEIHEWIRSNKYYVIHTGTDELCLWWFDRSATQINNIKYDGLKTRPDRIQFSVSTASKKGVMIKIPVPMPGVSGFKCAIDGMDRNSNTKTVSGSNWVMIYISEGVHFAELEFHYKE